MPTSVLRSWDSGLQASSFLLLSEAKGLGMTQRANQEVYQYLIHSHEQSFFFFAAVVFLFPSFQFSFKENVSPLPRLAPNSWAQVIFLAWPLEPLGLLAVILHPALVLTI